MEFQSQIWWDLPIGIKSLIIAGIIILIWVWLYKKDEQMEQEETNMKKDKKPDGTIEHLDSKGNIIKETWIPPEKIDEYLDKTKALQVYKVFIKNLSSNVREEKRELPDDIVEQFVDNKSCAYAQEYFEEGEPQLIFMSKEDWGKSADQVFAELSSDPSSVKIGKLKGD